MLSFLQIMWNNLKKAFEDKNEAANAIHDINQLQQGTMKADKLVIRFKLLLSKTSIPTSNNNQALINLFMPTLNQGLLKRVLELNFPPNTIQGWCDATTKADGNWHRIQAIIGQPNSKKNFRSSANYSPSPVYTTDLPTQDPNAMDIDVLQTNDRETLMHAGICFYYKEQGHLVRNCPRKSRTNYYAPNHNSPTHFPQNSSQNSQIPFQPRTHTINIATIKATLEALTEEEWSLLISSMEDFPRGNWT